QIARSRQFRAWRGQVKSGDLQLVARGTIDTINLAAHWDFARRRFGRGHDAEFHASLRVTNRAHPEHVDIPARISRKGELIQWKTFRTENLHGRRKRKTR